MKERFPCFHFNCKASLSCFVALLLGGAIKVGKLQKLIRLLLERWKEGKRDRKYRQGKGTDISIHTNLHICYYDCFTCTLTSTAHMEIRSTSLNENNLYLSDIRGLNFEIPRTVIIGMSSQWGRLRSFSFLWNIFRFSKEKNNQGLQLVFVEFKVWNLLWFCVNHCIYEYARVYLSTSPKWYTVRLVCN